MAPDFLDLVALVQEGIDGAHVALRPIRHSNGDVKRALALVRTKLDEAEHWLEAAIRQSAIDPDAETTTLDALDGPRWPELEG